MQTIGVLIVFVLLFTSYNFNDTAGADEEAVLLEEPLSRDSVSVQSRQVLRPIPDLCDSPSIDAAVRVAFKKYIFLFKGHHYWVLNIDAKLLDDSAKPIVKDFTNDESVDLSGVEAAWVSRGFDTGRQDSGYINILKLSYVFRFRVQFYSPMTYDIKFNNSFSFDEFWSLSKHYGAIDTITQLNTYMDKEDKSNKPRDLLVLDQGWYQVLWSKDGTDMNYEMKHNFYAKSENGSNRLSIFDPATRELDYWNTIAFEPISDVLDITALVTFTSKSEVFAFGSKKYCKINIKSSAMNLMCKKRSLKTLYGCQRLGSTTIQSTSSGAPNLTENVGSVSDQPLNTESGTEDNDNKYSEKSSNPVFYIIGAIVVLIIIIAIFALIAWLYIRKSQKGSGLGKSISEETITKGPTDPRYGQLDSSLNLHLRIANPSIVSVDKPIADQKPTEDIKSESESSSGSRIKK